MLTRFYLTRRPAILLLIGIVLFACALPTSGRAQEARKGATTSQAPAASATLLSPDMLTPCTRIIPARTKLYGLLDQSTERCLYAFQGASGEVVTIHATSLDQVTTPQVRLLAPRGAELVAGSATSTTVGSLIYAYRLRESGLHTVVVETSDAAAFSQFRLSLAGNSRCGGKLNPDTVITAQLSDNARYCVYSFTGQADARWQVEAYKLDGGAAPEVDLFDPRGISVRRLPGTTLPQGQAYQLPADGIYSLLVNAAQMADIGSFELALTPAADSQAEASEASLFAPGQEVRNVYPLNDGRVNLRRTPGHLNKPANDVLLNMPGEAVMVVLGAAVNADRLPWWPVLYTDEKSQTHTGWVAEATDTGQTILGSK